MTPRPRHPIVGQAPRLPSLNRLLRLPSFIQAPRAPWFFALATLFLFSLRSAHPQTAPPNILFIFADDLGWRDTGFMGSDFYETPHLDQLAGEGMVFTAAYSGAANCAPARACLLSGQYSPRHEIYNVGTGPRGNAKHRKLLHLPGTSTLRPDISTWAQQLQQAGYQTASIGKWHLGKDPVPYGFHHNIAGSHSGSPPRGYYPPHGKVPGLENAPPGEYLTDRLNAEAVKFIKQNRSRPWMVYLSHFAVHTPLQPKRELIGKYQNKPAGKLHRNAIMATMIQAIDDGVGELVRTLAELGIAGNTVVIFYSDNGGYGPATDMAPLKGYKGSYYEGGIRVPLVVKWPGIVSPGARSPVPVTEIDFHPHSFCVAVAGKKIARPPIDKKSPASLRTAIPILVRKYDQMEISHSDCLIRRFCINPAKDRPGHLNLPTPGRLGAADASDDSGRDVRPRTSTFCRQSPLLSIESSIKTVC